METGHDTIKQYVKSLANHQVLSPEDEVILGKQIQILARWEERATRVGKQPLAVSVLQ
jgi:hypothetical protein